MRIELYDDGIGAVEYVSHMGTDLTVVNAARVSFAVEKQEMDPKDEKLIKYLLEHNHTSPFEHCMLTLRFKVPLFIRSQHHRHRTWSYNEISRRYTGVDMKFYSPQLFRTQHKSNRQASNEEWVNPELDMGTSDVASQVRAHHASSLYLYKRMIESGVCREQARGVLPQNLYTEYYGTANLHNLFKFISLRSHEGAQWEIQKVAEACLDVASSYFPVCTEYYKEIKGMT